MDCRNPLLLDINGPYYDMYRRITGGVASLARPRC